MNVAKIRFFNLSKKLNCVIAGSWCKCSLNYSKALESPVFKQLEEDPAADGIRKRMWAACSPFV